MFLISWIIAFILVVLAYMLPVGAMHQHAVESLPVFEAEGISPTLISGFQSTYLDTYTDMTMILTAVYEGKESVLDKAMGGLRYGYGESNIFEEGVRYLSGEREGQTVSYARYWHGWIVFLKPLLLFLNYSEIRMLNFILQTVLVIFLLKEMYDNECMRRYIIPFVSALMVIMPLSTAMCMGLAILYYVILVSLILFIRYNQWLIEKRWIPFYFMVVGIVTSFVDLVTYPLTTMGLLLVTCKLLNQSQEKESGLREWRNSACLVISWCIGYLSMWTGKWLIGSITTDENVLKDAVLMVLYRASYESGEGGSTVEIRVGDVISRNLGVLCNPIYICMFVCVAVIIIAYSIKDNIRIVESKYEMVLLFIIGFFPLIWYMCIGNHSYIHYWMTYKSLSITAYAWGSLLVNYAYKIKKTGCNENG